jgi:class 3 adenylate cyclase
VSVLFVDLVGYTSISESRDPEDVRTLLSAYFDTARTIVERYGGRVEKFIGDAVMAVWGSPVALEDDAERAVRAALELVAQVPVFGAEAGIPHLQARGGVVTGQAASVVDPAEGLVVGDRVNTASRVQSAAAPGTVLVDEVSRVLTEGSVAYEDAGDHTVKGKSEPLHLWRATRVVAGTKGKGREDGLEPAFVGRDTEFSLVKALLHDSMDRRSARLVTLVGEAGVGKSRLVWEFYKYTDGIADTLLWHRGRCPRYGDGVAYSAFAEIVRARLGIADDDPGDVVATKVADGLARYLDDPVERDYLIPRVGRLVGLDDGEGLSRDELFSGWRLLVERMSQSAPFVMVIEDAQWADTGLLDFVEHLLEWSAQTPVFVLMATRPDLLERRDGWGSGRRNATLVYLEALSPSAITSLIDDVVPDMPTDLRERIAERSDGIPLYVVETIRALLDQGRLRRGPDGRYHVADDQPLELTVPASLTALIAARLDALAPDSRSVVRTLSVYGTAFTRSAAGALCGLDAVTLDEVLADLVHRDVLTVRADPLSPRRGEYQFNQALLQTVAYDTLSKPERRQLHAAAAEHLRTALPDEGDEVIDVVAAHYLAAMRAGPADDAESERLRGLAFDAYQRAADRAERLGATVTARSALEHAAGLATSGSDAAELLERAAVMAWAGLETDEAARLLEAASAAHSAAGDDRNARRLLAIRSGASRDTMSDDVRAELEDALGALAQGPRDRGYAEVAIMLATTTLHRGEPLVDVIPRFEDALAAAEASGDMVLVARGLGGKGILMAWSGRPVEAEALFTFALATAQSAGDSTATMQAYGNLTDHLLNADAPSAVERAEESVAQARRLGQRNALRILLANVWLGLAFVGRWGDLEEQTQAQLGESDFGDVHARLSLVRAWQGRLEEATRELELTEAAYLESSMQDREILAAARATVLLAQARDEEALAAAQLVMDSDAGIRREAYRVAMPAAAEAALRLGRLDAADAILDQVAGRGPGDAPPFLRAQAARYRGRVRQARGDLGDAVLADLHSAVSTLDELGYPYWAALARLDLAAALAGAGAVDEARAAAHDVVEAAERLGAAPLRDRAVAFLDAASSAVPA